MRFILNKYKLIYFTKHYKDLSENLMSIICFDDQIILTETILQILSV